MRTVRMILVGGFLGAGKTTLLARTAHHLAAQGRRVGLITNDQAQGLVDTGLLRQTDLAVAEVAGGCFCCRFDDLVNAAERLLDELKPDVLLGEPVGSCTDLSATVLQPLKRFYGEWFRVAPFSVLADPVRLREAMGEAPGGGFPESVLYIFRKQLEEADLIVINKADTLAPEERAALEAEVVRRYSGAAVLTMSALTGEGFDAWLNWVMEERPSGARIAEVDYDTYAEGEAVLGWLNATVRLRADTAPTRGRRDWEGFLRALMSGLRDEFRHRNAEVAHLKALLTTPTGALVSNLTSAAAEPVGRGEIRGAPPEALLVLNARVHIAPDDLKAVVEGRLAHAAAPAIAAEVVSFQSFSPARPRPTHRFASPA